MHDLESSELRHATIESTAFRKFEGDFLSTPIPFGIIVSIAAKHIPADHTKDTKDTKNTKWLLAASGECSFTGRIRIGRLVI